MSYKSSHTGAEIDAVIGRFDSDGNLTISGDSVQRIYLISTTDGFTEIRLGDTADTDASAIKYDNATNIFSIRSGAGTRLGIDSSGHVITPYGVTLGTSSYSDYQAANTLDDYEEGTWTPALSDAASGGNTAAFETVYAKYTKIGNIVHLSMTVLNIDTTGMTSGNILFIQGLPFTVKSSTYHAGSCVLDGFSLDEIQVNPYAASNHSYFTLNTTRASATDGIISVGDITASTADITALNISYLV